MNYWLTTQWSPRPLQPPKPFGVYVQDGKLDVIANMLPGDLVFFYESKTGRNLVNPNPAGLPPAFRSGRGRGGVIILAEIVGAPAESGEPKQIYANRSHAWWRYYANAKVLDDTGFVSLSDLNRILGYAPGCRLRGFGDGHSGVKKIDKATFDAIRSAF